MSLSDDINDLLTDLNTTLKNPELFQKGTSSNWSDIKGWISTGCFLLDLAMTSYNEKGEALGGGFARGRWYEIFGPESVGKTTLYLQAMAANAKAGGLNALIDSEARLYKPRAIKMGLDLDKVVMIDSPYLELGVESLTQLLKKIKDREALRGRPLIIAWDTIANVPTKAEYEKGMYASGQAAKARMIHEMIRDLTPHIAESNATLLLINQQIATMSSYGKATDTTGGSGTKYQSSARLELGKAGAYNSAVNRDEVEGIITRVRFVKSSLFKPMGEVEYAQNFESGIDDLLSIVNFSVRTKLVTSSGGRYKCPEYQEANATGKYLRDFLDLLREDDLFVEFLKNRAKESVKEFWKKAASYAEKDKEKE